MHRYTFAPSLTVLLSIQTLAEDANGVANNHSAGADCRVIPHLLLPFLDEIAPPEFGDAYHIGLETMSKKLSKKLASGGDWGEIEPYDMPLRIRPDRLVFNRLGP